MKINYSILLLIFLVLTNEIILANGSPIDGSEMLRTGNIVPLRKEKIQLRKESLFIKINDNDASIAVVYHLINSESFTQEITYGFPVDISENVFFQFDSTQLREGQNYISSIIFRLDSVNLPIISIKKHGKLNEEIKSKFDELLPYRFWYIVKFSLPPSQVKTLVVKYNVKAYYSDWVTNKSIIPMFGDRIIGYDLTPAQHWGNATIDSLNIFIDGTYVNQQKGNLEISGLPFQKKNNIYQASFKNFSLKTNKSIIILYNHNNIAIDYLKRTSIKKSDIKYIRASSTLSTSHNASNLFDLNLATAWAEGINGNGVGQTIEIELHDIPVYLVSIVNGYTKSENLYQANNKVKLIEIELVFIPKEGIKKERIYKKRVNLSENVNMFDGKSDIYAYLNPLFDPYEDFLFENSNGETETASNYLLRKIKLKILSVTKGITFDDTCISEIIIQKEN